MKKGFTLVEVLGIIILLSVVLLISFPLFSNYVENTKQKTYETELELMINSLRDYAIENREILPVNQNDYIVLTLGQLKSFGIVKNSVKDPRNEKEIEDSLEFIIRKTDTRYTYQIDESTLETRDTTESSPTIELEGDEILYYVKDSEYIEPGYKAFDYNGNEITDININKESLNMNEIGIYFIRYIITDDNNIRSYAIRTIIVTEE